MKHADLQCPLALYPPSKLSASASDDMPTSSLARPFKHIKQPCRVQTLELALSNCTSLCLDAAFTLLSSATIWRRCPRRCSRGSTASYTYAIPADQAELCAHTCAGISRPAAYILRYRPHTVRLSLLKSTNRSLHLRKWRLCIAPHPLRHLTCRFPRSDLPIPDKDMGAAGLPSRVAYCLRDSRQGHVGAARAARRCGGQSISSILERLD